jgi:hypothetical protein
MTRRCRVAGDGMSIAVRSGEESHHEEHRPVPCHPSLRRVREHVATRGPDVASEATSGMRVDMASEEAAPATFPARLTQPQARSSPKVCVNA